MPTQFAINGMGRIGRCLARIAVQQPELSWIASNDLVDSAQLARLLSRDSLRGPFPVPVRAEGDRIVLGPCRSSDRAETSIATFAEREPCRVPWEGTGAQVVVEATGHHLQRREAAGHLRAQVAAVLISAIAEDADLVLCPGIEGQSFDPRRHRVLSLASCTTHCLALLLRVLDDEFGLRSALMNEVHGYTTNQVLLDGPHSDARRGRAAAINIVPTRSAAPRTVMRLMPQLEGKVAGQAVRVPVANGALLEVVVRLDKTAQLKDLEQAFRAAAAGSLTGLLGVSEEPLVSSDYCGDSRSAVVDLPLLQEVGQDQYRIVAWYDNEWGYSHRLAEALVRIGESLQ